MVSIFFIALIGFRIKFYISAEKQQIVVDLYILKQLLVFKIVIFMCNEKIYYQINKKEIREIKHIDTNMKFKPYISLYKMSINIGYPINRAIESMLIIESIKKILSLIEIANEDINCKNIIIRSSPIEEEDMFINGEVVIKLEIFKMLFENMRRIWKLKQLKNS